MTNREGYYYVEDSNTVMAISLAVSLFLYFKNIEIKNSKIINSIASTTFGIFLIHTNSDSMRVWLWKKTVHVTEIYLKHDLKIIVLHVVLSSALIFVVCMVIDKLREKLLEKPLLTYMNKFNWINARIE